MRLLEFILLIYSSLLCCEAVLLPIEDSALQTKD